VNDANEPSGCPRVCWPKITKARGVDARTLEYLILAALGNKGRIPAGVRNRYKARMPEGLVEAIEAEVWGKLSRERREKCDIAAALAPGAHEEYEGPG
jgi:hypothetical protein